MLCEGTDLSAITRSRTQAAITPQKKAPEPAKLQDGAGGMAMNHVGSGGRRGFSWRTTQALMTSSQVGYTMATDFLLTCLRSLTLDLRFPIHGVLGQDVMYYSVGYHSS
jgi:hypothetical protein